MKRLDARRALAFGAGTVTVLLTGAAFWLSYEHLHDVASDNGLKDPARAWAWPGTVDLFIVAGELLLLRSALRHQVDLWAVALAGSGSLGSIALNVAGVGTGAQPLEYVVAAVPPVAALLAFGALMRQVHEALATAGPEFLEEPAEPERDLYAELAALQVANRYGDPVMLKRRPVPEVVPAEATFLPIVSAESLPTITIEREPAAAGPQGYPTLGPFVPVAELLATPVAPGPDPVALLSVADVAKAVGVAEGTVRSWVSRNKLAPVQRDDGGRLLFHPDAVAALN